jgi:hypothetical protein
MDMQATPPARTGPVDKLLFLVAGTDPDLLSQCPEHDRQVMRALGALLMANWCYESTLLYKIAALCSGSPSEFQPQLLLAATGLASFVLAIDSLCVFRSHWWRAGLAQLAAAGLRIENGYSARIHAGFFFMVRFCLATSLALLTGLFFGLIIYAGDIGQRLHSDYLLRNVSATAHATMLVDRAIEAAQEAVKSQTARVEGLSHQVTELREDQIDDPVARQAQQEVTRLIAQQEMAQEQLRKAEATASSEMGGIKTDATSGHAGNGPRRRAALEQVESARKHVDEVNRDVETARARLDKARAGAAANENSKSQYRDSLPGYVSALSQEEAKLAAFKDQVAALVEHREHDIETKLKSAPDYSPQESGLLSQFAALDAIAHDNPKIGWTVLLIELCAFGFELASVLAVTSAPPTCYAALRARDSYVHDVTVADAIMAVLNAVGGGRDSDNEPAQADVAAPPASKPSDDTAPSASKRPRGRPRKSAFTITPVGPPTQA